MLIEGFDCWRGASGELSASDEGRYKCPARHRPHIFGERVLWHQKNRSLLNFLKPPPVGAYTDEKLAALLAHGKEKWSIDRKCLFIDLGRLT